MPGWFAAELAEAQSALYCFACALLGGSADAWDVVQTANKVMLEKWSQVQLPSDFMPWAYTVVRFQVMAHCKNRSRERHIFNLGVLDKIAQHAASHSAEVGERVVALEECLQQLPERQREYVALRYGQEMSLHEVAQRLKRPENAVAAVLYRARLALARCIEGKLAEGAAP
jgi:RNA polymerase sigma-70 factor, ECF subfamily